jgi:hypothetical protein
VDALTSVRHFALVPREASDALRPADGIEVEGSRLKEYP